MRKMNIWACLCLSLLWGFASCESLDDSIGSDPYGGGKEPLGIKLLSEAPVPSSGVPGDTILFHAKGLSAWCDPQAGRYDFRMFMGDEEAEIVSATDSTLQVKVPQEVSTGLTYLVLENQVFYGPMFTIDGNISIDRNYGLFKNQSQFSGAIYDAVESKQKNQGGTFYVVGDMSYKVNGSKTLCHGIGLIDRNGNITSQTNGYFESVNGSLVQSTDGTSAYPSSISLLKDNRMLVSGLFSNFYVPMTSQQNTQMGLSNYINVNNMSLLTSTALADTLQLTFSDSYTTSGSTATSVPLPVASFNGGFREQVVRSFVVPTTDGGEKVIAVGNMTQYITTAWASAYANSVEQTSEIQSVCRLNMDGSLDASYRPASLSLAGPQGGTVSDACADEEGGVVIVGSFTSFDGIKAQGIVRLDAAGRVDESFMANLQGGVNGSVSCINYNTDIHAMVIAGNFTQVGNHSTQYLGIIRQDGSIDTSFSSKGFEGGQPTFATIVSKQKTKVVASGTFSQYAGVHRKGFLILDCDGVATQQYNVSGTFTGELHKVVETETSLGDYGLLLLGDFNMFNNETVNNAVMLQADFR